VEHHSNRPRAGPPHHDEFGSRAGPLCEPLDHSEGEHARGGNRKSISITEMVITDSRGGESARESFPRTPASSSIPKSRFRRGGGGGNYRRRRDYPEHLDHEGSVMTW
jgi:hypothetical protein